MKPSTAATFLRTCFVTGGGAIDSWGVIRVLDTSVLTRADFKDSLKERLQFPLILRPGNSIWSEKLVRYGNGDHSARVERDNLAIYNAFGIADQIPFDDCILVHERECFVHNDGHLEYSLVHQDYPGFFDRYLRAIAQAERGERPSLLDDSLFVRIDKQLAGQEVIKLTIDDDHAMVFTLRGERIPATCHRLISHARWNTEHMKSGVFHI